MLVYVDDIILTGNDTNHLNRFIDLLSNRFSFKDLGTLSYFLGIETHRSSKGLLLTKSRYIADLLERTKMIGTKPVSTPMCPHASVSLHSGTLLSNPTEYRAVVEGL